ncbi:hypothetical protein HK102_006129 [Quaeritorhiza haematococci]|nr:hypothetical protein HK102_006129 [Quaeritorhiza haematococci]
MPAYLERPSVHGPWAAQRPRSPPTQRGRLSPVMPVAKYSLADREQPLAAPLPRHGSPIISRYPSPPTTPTLLPQRQRSPATIVADTAAAVSPISASSDLAGRKSFVREPARELRRRGSVDSLSSGYDFPVPLRHEDDLDEESPADMEKVKMMANALRVRRSSAGSGWMDEVISRTRRASADSTESEANTASTPSTAAPSEYGVEEEETDMLKVKALAERLRERRSSLGSGWMDEIVSSANNSSAPSLVGDESVDEVEVPEPEPDMELVKTMADKLRERRRSLGSGWMDEIVAKNVSSTCSTPDLPEVPEETEEKEEDEEPDMDKVKEMAQALRRRRSSAGSGWMEEIVAKVGSSTTSTPEPADDDDEDQSTGRRFPSPTMSFHRERRSSSGSSPSSSPRLPPSAGVQAYHQLGRRSSLPSLHFRDVSDSTASPSTNNGKPSPFGTMKRRASTDKLGYFSGGRRNSTASPFSSSKLSISSTAPSSSTSNADESNWWRRKE